MCSRGPHKLSTDVMMVKESNFHFYPHHGGCVEVPNGKQFIMCPSSWACHQRSMQAHVCINYTPSIGAHTGKAEYKQKHSKVLPQTRVTSIQWSVCKQFFSKNDLNVRPYSRRHQPETYPMTFTIANRHFKM